MRTSLPRSRGCATAAALALLLVLAATLAGPAAAQQQVVGGVSTTLAAGGIPGGSSSFSSSSSSASSSGVSAGAPGSSGCQTLTQTSSNSCANGACCDVKQRITACAGHTTALASVNGATGSCCVVLVSAATGGPAAFCASPVPKAGSRLFPPGVSVTLSPDCSNTPAGSAGSLTCTAAFPALPAGFARRRGRARCSRAATPPTGALPRQQRPARAAA